MFGRKAAFGLKDLNLPEEALEKIQDEEELMKALGLPYVGPTDDGTMDGSNDDVPVVEEETDQPPVNYMTISSDDEINLQSIENIPVVVQQTSEENSNGNYGTEGCVSCYEFVRTNEAVNCSLCEKPCHYFCVSSDSTERQLCRICSQKEIMEAERRGTKRKQEQQADVMLRKSSRRFKEAKVGDTVVVHLPEVDRGRCEFPNVMARVMAVNEAGMFKLATRNGVLKGVYSRSQFEPLPSPLLSLEDINTEV